MSKVTFILTLFICNFLVAQKYAVELVLRNNSSASDICPAIYEDGIVFMSNEKNEYLRTVKDKNNNYPYHLFYQKIDSNKTQGKRVPFAENIATLYNDGPVYTYQNDTKLIYSKNTNSETLKKNRSRTMGLFFSEKNGEIWSDPIPFEYNSMEYNITHPSINEQGDLLVFCSSNEAGFGGMDLYYSINKNGKWQHPINFGEMINTKGNDVYPSMSGNKIYFSTDGRNDTTGLDIYSFNFIDNTIKSMPLKLDSAINSQYDDFGIAFKKDMKSGFLTSNRKGSDQIYYFKKLLPTLENCPPQKKISYCYLIEEHNMLDESGMPLKFTWDLGDGNKVDGYRVKHCYDTLGLYTATLNIVDTVTGDIFHEVSQVKINIKAENLPKIVTEDTIIRNELSSFEAELTYLQEPQEEVFWQINTATKIIGKSFQEKYTKEDSLIVNLGVIDGNGNLKCVSKAIKIYDTKPKSKKAEENTTTEVKPNTQLKAKESYSVKVLSSNEKVAINDSRFNKVDYPIIESYVELEQLYNYTVGQSKKIDELYYLFKEMEALGFETELIKIELKEVLQDQPKGLVKVYFGIGDAKITAFNIQNINTFVSNLKPGTKLKVSGFADPNGDATMNKKLSLERAKNVQKELTKLGIPKSRISVIAVGEIASADKDIEKLKMLRKVEVQIIQ